MLLLLLSACGGEDTSGDASPRTTSAPDTANGSVTSETGVSMRGFEFVPKTLTIAAGTNVIWTNEDDAAHSIKDASELETPVSADLKDGDTFSITYPEAGTYDYICGIHNYMKGSIEVTS